MHPRRRHIGHNKDIKFIEQLVSRSKRERLINARARYPKSQDIQDRIEKINSEREKMSDKGPNVNVNSKSAKVDDDVLNTLRKAYDSEGNNQAKNEDLDDETSDSSGIEANTDNLKIVTIKKTLELSNKSTKLSKYRDIVDGEKAVFVRAGTEQENNEHEEEVSLLEFDDYIYQSVLNPEKDTNQYLVPNQYIEGLNDSIQEKSSSNADSVVNIENLHALYKSFMQPITSLGLEEFADEFFDFCCEIGADQLIFAFVEHIIEERKPELFSTIGFFQVLENKPLVEDPSDLDELLLRFIQRNLKAREWFSSKVKSL